MSAVFPSSFSVFRASVFVILSFFFLIKSVQTCESQQRGHWHQAVFCAAAKCSTSGSWVLPCSQSLSFCSPSLKSNRVLFIYLFVFKGGCWGIKCLLLDASSFLIHKKLSLWDLILHFVMKYYYTLLMYSYLPWLLLATPCWLQFVVHVFTNNEHLSVKHRRHNWYFMYVRGMSAQGILFCTNQWIESHMSCQNLCVFLWKRKDKISEFYENY